MFNIHFFENNKIELSYLIAIIKFIFRVGGEKMNKLNKDKYIARGWKNENKRFKDRV